MEVSIAESGLLGCLQANKPINKKILRAFTTADWERFCKLAIQHRVMPLLDYRFKEESLEDLLPVTVKEQLAAKFREQTYRNLALQVELCKIVKGWQKVRIPVIVLKGMHLAPLIYPHLGLRQMHDLDLLVAPENARRASEVLETLGYRLAKPLSESDLDFSLSQHLPVMTKDDFIVEIHGRICKPDKLYSIDTQILWNNAQRVEIGGLPVQVLDPIDLFLHLCIHISYMHLFIRGIRHYYDLVVILGHYGADFDWQKLVQRTRERNWERGVLVVLEVSQQLFGLQFPDEVVTELEHSEDRAMIEEMVQAAFSELWTTHAPESQNFSPSFADLPFKKGWWNKARFLSQRVFLPPKLMARNYSTEAGSWKMYLYYLVRIKDLLLRYNSNMVKLIRGDRQVTSAAERKNSLQNWLEKR